MHASNPTRPAVVLRFDPQARQSSRRQSEPAPAARREPLNPFSATDDDPGGFFAWEWGAVYYRAIDAGKSVTEAIATADDAAPRHLWEVEMVS